LSSRATGTATARCLFHDCTGWKPELYAADAGGGGERRLTETDLQELFPDWSPDGQRIVFARIGDDNDDYELFVIAADGSEPRQLTDNNAFDWMPDWFGPPR
jgi:Tol biopolymer transport system component